MSSEYDGIKRILFVDDSRDEYELFQLILKQARPDMELTWFDSGDKLMSFLSGPKGIDSSSLIVMDVHMPLKDAKDILLEMDTKGIIGRLPILIISSLSNPEDISFYEQFPRVSYARKPCGLSDYQSFIASFDGHVQPS